MSLFTNAAENFPSNAGLIATSNQDMPIVRVNGVEITPKAIAQELQYHPAESQREATFFAVQALVIAELLRQKAQELGIEVQAQEGESAAEATTRAVLEQEVQTPEISTEQIERYYQSNPKKFTTPPLVSVRHILIAADPEDEIERSQKMEIAQSLIKELQQGANFAQLAAVHSACPSKQHGGELGQLSKGQTVPEFERSILRLPLGLSTAPIESRYGYHIVDIQQRVEGELLPLHLLKERISQELSQRVWHKGVAQYLQLLVAEATIEGIVLNGAESPLLQ